MDRRTYLRNGLATGAIVAIAGCAGFSDEDAEADENTSDGGSGDDPGADDADDPADQDDEEEDHTDDELVGTFDDFEDLDPWEAFQGIGSIEADTDQSSEGNQSALLEPDDDGQVRMRRSLDDPIDIEDVVPGIAMTAETESIVRIQLQDEDGDYIEYSQRVSDNMPLVRHNFGVTRIRGDPNLNEIIVLQVIHWVDEEAEDGRLWVDDFHFVPNTDTPKVMLQFHGGYESHAEEALPILEEYDLTGTTFIPTDRVRADRAVDGDRLTRDQVADLADAGWTIGSYSAQGSRLDAVETAGGGLEANITDPIEWLEEQGYDEGARFFAYPNAAYDEASYEQVQEHYDLAFAGRAPAQGYAGNPHLCSITESPDSESEATQLLEWTAEYGGITTIPFFTLEEEEAVEALEATASMLADLEEEGAVDVIAPAEMADEYVL